MRKKYFYLIVLILMWGMNILFPVSAKALPWISTKPATHSYLNIFYILTLLTFIPLFIISCTPFIRVVIVLLFLQRSLTLRLPPTQVIFGLALIISFSLMAGVLNEIKENSVLPYLKGKIPLSQALNKAILPIKLFLIKNASPHSLMICYKIARERVPKKKQDVSLKMAIPAFLLNELKKGLLIGSAIFIPFMLIDLIVASILMSMGMIMLPPAQISLPFKLALVLLTDGFYYIFTAIAV